jgi:uncharacterized protein
MSNTNKKRDGVFEIPDSASLPSDGGPEFNRLVFTSSPYLLQHARNPVDWYPWCEAAFEKAARENKPIFLSIGYSTCHWCHVMEHESFEDEEVASFLNAHFVSIKVDREERPDVDHLYMSVCQAATGSGGWPLTIFMTADKHPFFAGTYFPKHSRYGRPGFMDVLHKLTDVWQIDRQKIDGVSTEMLRVVSDRQQPEEAPLTTTIADRAAAHLRMTFDHTYGGFGQAPKFPMGHSLSFLLRFMHRTENTDDLQMVERTLQRMHRGGMFDHVGFGFCRYSTDREWLVPHFEKMLYDNALLLLAYADAYQVTRNAEYRSIAMQITAYILRDMTDERGGFYSAENADSEGEEGKFYVFTKEEFLRIAGGKDAVLLCDYFGVTDPGNFEHGTNILHIAADIDELAARHNSTKAEVQRIIEACREKLFAARAARIHPSLDDKILASWNGLMIAALARAGQAFDDASLTAAAERAARFVMTTMTTPDGRLFHRYRNGSVGIPGFLEDYACFAWGLLELYEATFHKEFLLTAFQLAENMISDFMDEEDGGFFIASSAADDVPLRMKDSYDGALPSGNAVAAFTLIKLARLTGNERFEQCAKRTFAAFASQIRSSPASHTFFLTALDFALGSTKQIILAGKNTGDVADLARAIRSRFIPDKTLLCVTERDEDLLRIAPYLSSYMVVGGKATAYLCENFACRLPVTTAEELLAQLGNNDVSIPL